MDEESILKLKEHDEAEIIPKEKWDGTKDKETFRFVPLGEGKYREIIYDANNKPIDIKDYQVVFGLIFDINNEKDPGYFFYLYKNNQGKYFGEWIRSIKGALWVDIKSQLKEEYVWDAITTAVNIIIDSEALVEFKKIIEALALGNVLIRYLEDYNIKIEELNTKKYFYNIYKYALKGNLDFDTFNNSVGLKYSDDWVELDPDLIESIQHRIESAYTKMANKN